MDIRLIAMRTPFMKIFRNYVNSNLKLKGPCTNFHHANDHINRILPHNQDDIALICKFILSNKFFYRKGLINPKNIRKAINWLLENNNFYQTHDVKINETILRNIENNMVESIIEEHSDNQNPNKKEENMKVPL